MLCGPSLLTQTFLSTASITGAPASWFTGVPDLASQVMAWTVKVKVELPLIKFQALVKKKTEPSLLDPRGEVCWPRHKLESYYEGVELMDLTSCCLGVKPGAHHLWWDLRGSVRCLRCKTL